jgi:HK97 gp10 family phage protein
MASRARVGVEMTGGWFARLREAIRPQIENIAAEIEADIKRNAPVDTGELVRSIRRRGTVITISAPHWHFVEYGTRPHIIRPRTKKALWWPGAAHPVSQVRHPGTQAQPFIRPAATKQRRLRGIRVTVDRVEVQD